MSQRHSVFARMWGVAVIAHLAGNWAYGDIWPNPTPIGWVLAASGLVATILVVAPSRAALLALSVLVPVSALLEAPVLGNHWLLASMISVGYLITAGEWERFEPVARTILLVFYSFAAFAKLNTGFLDPSTSCAVVYANQWLGGFGFDGVAADGIVGRAAGWGSALVELAVPFLLLIRRTRVWGVALAVAFHGLISFDLGQHFFDFTAVLVALFALFLPDAYFERFAGAMAHLRQRRALSWIAIAIGVLVTVSNTFPLSSVTLWWLSTGTFFWWSVYVALVVWSLAGVMGQTSALAWRIGPVAAVLVALAFFNGLTPYLEVKTAYGWNMYSNLVTVGGETNHLLVASTWPLREGNGVLVEVMESTDPGLQVYADEGYLLPWPSFASYLADHPRVRATYRIDDRTLFIDGAAIGDIPWWWRWMPLRAVHADQPERCQMVFLPAL